MAFVFAYRKDTGEKVPNRVPESHLRIFSDLLSKTPRQKATEKAAKSAPTTPVTGTDKKE